MNKINSFFSSLEGAYAPNTIRSYRLDYMHYANWCQEYQYNPLDIKEEEFAEYISSMGGKLTVATIQRKIASLNSIFTLSRNKNPTKDPIVILTIKKNTKKIWQATKTSNTSNLRHSNKT